MGEANKIAVTANVVHWAISASAQVVEGIYWVIMGGASIGLRTFIMQQASLKSFLEMKVQNILPGCRSLSLQSFE